MADQPVIALSAEMTADDAKRVFEQDFIGRSIAEIDEIIADDFQVAYVADGTAYIHVSIKKPAFPVATIVKFVVHAAFDNGVASEILSVQRGLIGL